MLSINEFKSLFREIKSMDYSQIQNSEKQIHDESIFNNFIETLRMKIPEISVIFKKFDIQGTIEFTRLANLIEIEDDVHLFKKSQEIKDFYLIIQGDIQLIEEGESNKIIKTISSGNLFGHKIKSAFTNTGIAKNHLILITIEKNIFDNLINDINKRKNKQKIDFLKKNIPKFRFYSDDVIDNLKSYFTREEYTKGTKVFIDNEYDEFVYIIFKGEVGCMKSLHKLDFLKRFPEEASKLSEYSHIILETLKRGDIFGVYSALKHQKNNYTVEVTSKKATIYKILKSHILYYFGGTTGALPSSLRGIDTVQQNNLMIKLEFLENIQPNQFDLLTNFSFRKSQNESAESKIIIDESDIVNFLKDAWKDLENLESKLSGIKSNLLQKKSAVVADTSILNKLKEKEAETVADHTKVMGFGTNRVVANKLVRNNLNSNQLKGMSMLNSICAIKKKTSAIENPEEKKEVEKKPEVRVKSPNKLRALQELDREECNEMKNVENAKTGINILLEKTGE